MRTVAFAIALGITSCFAVACASSAPAPANASAAAGLKAPGTAQIGDKTTCPVSGEEFVVSASSPKVEVEGKTYFFCCPHCAEKFRSDPKKFTAKLGG